MHSAVLQNEKYIKFANENTVEVMVLGSLEKGIEKQDKKAETYTKKVNGQDVEYLVEFPNLTVQDIEAVKKSKAGTFNDSGAIPFTVVVDPHTEAVLWRHVGGFGSGTLMDAVKEARKELDKAHGKGLSRKTLSDLAAAEAASAAALAEGEFAAALAALAKVEKDAKDWPQTLQARVARSRQAVIAAAEKALGHIEASAADDPAQAGRDLSRLTARLRGTGLEERARELMELLKG